MRELRAIFPDGARRAALGWTTTDLAPCKIPPKAVVAVRQMRAPKSRFAEIGERKVLSLCGRSPAT
jgi:hypothetical protein